MDRIRIARNILILAFVLVFGTFGVWKFINPIQWIGWIPLWFDGIFGSSREVLLKVFGTFEVTLALLLIIPIRRVRQVTVIFIILHLIAVITQVGWNDVGVRDTGLVFAALALLLLI